MRRRAALRAAVTTVGTAIAGCLGRLDGGSEGTLPERCPTSRDLDVDWPDELTASTVGSFVERYEGAYYREEVVEYEPRTRLDDYRLGVSVRSGPTPNGDGYEVEVSGGGAVYRPHLRLTAVAVTSRDDVDSRPSDHLDGVLAAVVEEAAANPDEEVQRLVTATSAVARYVETVDEMADGQRLSGRGDTAYLNVDVDGTTVRLEVDATSFHGDYGWRARYYVDEHVVRRTTDEEVDPAEGWLLECRTDP